MNVIHFCAQVVVHLLSVCLVARRPMTRDVCEQGVFIFTMVLITPDVKQKRVFLFKTSGKAVEICGKPLQVWPFVCVHYLCSVAWFH